MHYDDARELGLAALKAIADPTPKELEAISVLTVFVETARSAKMAAVMDYLSALDFSDAEKARIKAELEGLGRMTKEERLAAFPRQ